MKCPHCASPSSRVIESRESDDEAAIRRRRECLKCHNRFTTYERIERIKLLIVKKSGERELFDRDKIAHGIYKACEKRPISALKIEELINDIEQQIFAYGQDEIPSHEVGELVMSALAKLDEIAYVRFASVYRSFTSIESFQKAVADLRQTRQHN